MTRFVRAASTVATRALPHVVLVTIVVGGVLLIGARVADAAGTPEEQCQQGRYAAAAKYAACEQKVMAIAHGGAPYDDKFGAMLSRCRVKYAATWTKLQAKASGTMTACDHGRYDDHGDGTVTDRLTGLQWEQKTADATIHDKDSLYSRSATLPFTIANGTAFTSFLATLNGTCFAGQCDWRLPTIAELQTIALEPYPCTTHPCIDESVFGPSTSYFYWAATTHVSDPAYAWVMHFFVGVVYFEETSSAFHVRAVRGGL